MNENALTTKPMITMFTTICPMTTRRAASVLAVNSNGGSDVARIPGRVDNEFCLEDGVDILPP
ncbi:hypothetical protein ACIBL8_37480 [Streptomyces sp. NPDC050523]|uniref:hypothetical protein n=1 Tax=Streptomyces sp. NPDC050523 TaxID=3365622 RepID=UPI003796E651